jgi:nicotinic acid mononucleotide adenylyltransferase
VDPWETEQKGWTTTYNALQHFQKVLSETPGSEKMRVKLLCGADLLESFATPDLWSDEHVRAEGARVIVKLLCM